MDREVRKLAVKQYLKYFRFWFIAVGLLLVLAVGGVIRKQIAQNRPRSNKEAAKERVYDFADMLSDSEEEDLREYIAEYEKKGKIDIVLALTNEPMGVEDEEWEYNMMNRADDIYDEGKYGYDKPYGDGALILYNWYVDEETGSQKGVWLSTSGIMEQKIGWREEDQVLDALEAYIFKDPIKGYKAAIKELANQANTDAGGQFIPFTGGMTVFPLIVSICYLIGNLAQKKARDTTKPTTYVVGGKPVINRKSDDFIRKHTTTYHIDTSSSSGGSGRGHSGGGSHGSHTSSGGHSHGGGGRRH